MLNNGLVLPCLDSWGRSHSTAARLSPNQITADVYKHYEKCIFAVAGCNQTRSRPKCDFHIYEYFQTCELKQKSKEYGNSKVGNVDVHFYWQEAPKGMAKFQTTVEQIEQRRSIKTFSEKYHAYVESQWFVDPAILGKPILEPKPNFVLCKVCDVNNIDFFTHIVSKEH